jgi:hypothetical protein
MPALPNVPITLSFERGVHGGPQAGQGSLTIRKTAPARGQAEAVISSDASGAVGGAAGIYGIGVREDAVSKHFSPPTGVASANLDPSALFS